MKIKIRTRKFLLLTGFVAVCMFGAWKPALAQGRLGKKYGTRDPRPCKDVAKTGPTISIAEATASFVCNAEHELGNRSLFLVEDVKITFIGKGYRPNPNAYSYPTEPDLNLLEYPIRGSYKRYQCGVPDMSPPGKNCWLYNEVNAKGSCYKDTYGQWYCSMTDAAVSYNDYEEVGPAGGTINQAIVPIKNPAPNN